jgi:hypothetical protein
MSELIARTRVRIEDRSCLQIGYLPIRGLRTLAPAKNQLRRTVLRTE